VRLWTNSGVGRTVSNDEGPSSTLKRRSTFYEADVREDVAPNLRSHPETRVAINSRRQRTHYDLRALIRCGFVGINRHAVGHSGMHLVVLPPG